METAVVIIVGIVALIVLLLALTLVARGKTGPPLVGRSVVVHTRKPDDRSIRGVLHGQYADRWTLREAVLLEGQQEIALGGIEHVPIGAISFVQEIEAPVESNGDGARLGRARHGGARPGLARQGSS